MSRNGPPGSRRSIPQPYPLQSTPSLSLIGHQSFSRAKPSSHPNLAHPVRGHGLRNGNSNANSVQKKYPGVRFSGGGGRSGCDGGAATGGAGGAGGGKKGRSSIESEYVSNLQQQVYFLELELSLLKKQGAGGLGDIRTPDGPLDEVMMRLREKYVSMESKHRDVVRQLESRIGDLTKALHQQTSALQRVGKSKDDADARARGLEAKLQSVVAAHTEQRLELDNTIAKLKKRCEQLGTTNNDLLTQVSEMKGTHAAETDRLRDEVHTLERDVKRVQRLLDASEEKYKDSQVALLELRQEREADRQQSMENILQQQLTSAKNENLLISQKLSKAEALYEQSQAANQTLQARLDKILDEKRQLEAANRSTRDELKRERERLALRARAKDSWSSQIVSLTAEVDKLKQRQAEYPDQLAARQNALDGCRSELAKTVARLERATVRLEESDALISTLRDTEHKLEDSNQKLQKQVILQGKDLSKYTGEHGNLRTENQKLRELSERLHAELTHMRKRVQVLSQVESLLRLGDMQHMAEKSKQVAESIDSLTTALKDEESKENGNLPPLLSARGRRDGQR